MAPHTHAHSALPEGLDDPRVVVAGPSSPDHFFLNPAPSSREVYDSPSSPAARAGVSPSSPSLPEATAAAENVPDIRGVQSRKRGPFWGRFEGRFESCFGGRFRHVQMATLGNTD